MPSQINVRNEDVAGGTTSFNIALPRPETDPRVTLYIFNASTGGQTAYISQGLPATSTSGGFVLAPNAFLIDSSSEGYICYQGALNAIFDAAGGTLKVVER